MSSPADRRPLLVSRGWVQAAALDGVLAVAVLLGRHLAPELRAR